MLKFFWAGADAKRASWYLIGYRSNLGLPAFHTILKSRLIADHTERKARFTETMRYLQGDNSVRTARAHTPPRSAGFTVLELLIVVAVMVTIAAFAVPAMQSAIYSAQCARAVGDIRTIGNALITYQVINAAPATTLYDVGYDEQMDPWGNHYQYLNLATVPAPSQTRTDSFSVPINTVFDLYSMGKDGLSDPSLTSAVSQDDVIWAGDGVYIGLASNY
jgi:general secretion pathway protein G